MVFYLLWSKNNEKREMKEEVKKMIDEWEIKFEEDLLKSGVIGYHVSKNEKYMHIQYVWYHNRFVVKSEFLEKETKNIFLELFENRKEEMIGHVNNFKKNWESKPLLYQIPAEFDIDEASIFIYFEETNQIYKSSIASFKKGNEVCTKNIKDIDMNLSILKEKYNIKELSIVPARRMEKKMYIYYEVTLISDLFESNDGMLFFAWNENRIVFYSSCDIEIGLDFFRSIYRDLEGKLIQKRKEKRLEMVFLSNEERNLKDMDEQKISISSILSNQNIRSVVRDII